MSIITSSTLITAVSVNNIISTASAVLSTAYGSGMISRPVTAGSPITTTEWINLVSDLRRCWIHQTGSLSGFPTVSSLPVPGNVITAKFGNTLQNIAKTVNDNVYVVPPVNQTQQFALASSTSTIYSVNNLTYQVDHTFTDNANANYFFNLGGRISAGLSRASGTYIGNTATWASFIDWANSQISSLAYSRNQWAVSTSINESYTSSTNYLVRLVIFAKDNRTIRSTLTMTTAELSGAPTIGTATATGTTTANVSFTAPASNGGATITSYTATSSPEGITGTLRQAGSGTITVSGLTAGTPYTFTVTATNSVGTSAASGASNSITTYSVPVNTVAPVVSGTATAGRVLTSTTGTWTGIPTPTYFYQWQRAGVNISGATNSTYTLVGADVGSAVRCVVTASNSAGRASANSNATSSVAAAVPVNTVAPVVSGTATVGQTLTATTGTWTGTPTPTYAYRWQRAGVDISGATSSTYTLVGADLGSAVRCVVTATNSAGSASANSNATSSVAAAATGTVPVNIVAPAVSGTATAGQVLTSTTGSWTGTPTLTYAYRWQRAGVDISGATSSTYTLVSGDTGNAIRCVVTATNAVGSASANSNAITVVVVATAPGAPTIGTATATGTTTANVSFTAPASNGGATITSYTATSSPGGRTGTLSQAGSGNITVTGLTAGTAYTFTVTATNSVGTSAASGASNSITTSSVPVNTVAPVVSGTATEEQTLTATTGTWTGTPTYAYRWQRAGVDISGATSSTYRLVGADVGSAIRCVVTATNSAGSASANSNATSSVTAALATIPVNTVAPVISGTPIITNTLTVTTGTWTGKPSSFTYQWQRLGVDISGATSSTYTLVRADAYDSENDPPKISCVVTAANTLGSTSAESNKIFVIFPFTPSPPRNLQRIDGPITGQRTETLSWDPPEDDGFSPITGYYVEWRSDLEDASASGYYGAQFGYTNQPITATQFTFPVNDSSSYRFTVRARNAYKISDDVVLYGLTGVLGPKMSFTITPSEVYVTEGEEVTFTITPTNVAIGTWLNWTVTPGPLSSEQNDFVEWHPSGSFYYEGQPLSIKLTAKLDGVYESPETFTLSLYPRPGMPDYYRYLYASATIHISDPAPIYNFRSGAPTSVDEGSSITFNVDTSNVADGTPIFWEVVNVSTENADFPTTTNFPDVYGYFNINNNTGSFSVTTKADNSTEGPQEFYIILRRFGHGGGGGSDPIAQSNNVTIIDTSRG